MAETLRDVAEKARKGMLEEMKARDDLTGRRFGRLVALELSAASQKGNPVWICRCDCGNKKAVRAGNLKAGRTKSCGCLRSKGGSPKNGKREGMEERLSAEGFAPEPGHREKAVPDGWQGLTGQHGAPDKGLTGLSGIRLRKEAGTGKRKDAEANARKGRRNPSGRRSGRRSGRWRWRGKRKRRPSPCWKKRRRRRGRRWKPPRRK